MKIYPICDYLVALDSKEIIDNILYSAGLVEFQLFHQPIKFSTMLAMHDSDAVIFELLGGVGYIWEKFIDE